MKKSKDMPWFPKKKYGTGWGLPNTWQGWIVLLAYIILSVTGFALLSSSSFRAPLFFSYFAILTMAFICVVWKKGAK